MEKKRHKPPNAKHATLATEQEKIGVDQTPLQGSKSGK